MTEIPEHLLKRAAAARAAKSGEAPPADTPAEATAATTPAEAPVVAAPAPVVEAVPEPVAPYVAAHHARRKVPWWAASALLLLPLWAFTYVGTLERPPQESTGVLAEGANFVDTTGASYGSQPASGSNATAAITPPRNIMPNPSRLAICYEKKTVCNYRVEARTAGRVHSGAGGRGRGIHRPGPGAEYEQC